MPREGSRERANPPAPVVDVVAQLEVGGRPGKPLLHEPEMNVRLHLPVAARVQSEGASDARIVVVEHAGLGERVRGIQRELGLVTLLEEVDELDRLAVWQNSAGVLSVPPILLRADREARGGRGKQLDTTFYVQRVKRKVWGVFEAPPAQTAPRRQRADVESQRLRGAILTTGAGSPPRLSPRSTRTRRSNLTVLAQVLDGNGRWRWL